MREDAILWEVKPDVGPLPWQRSLTVMPFHIGIVIRDGEMVDVFESGKRDLQMGNVRTYVASASAFTVTFWLKDPEDTQELAEGTVLDQDLPVLTSDGEVVTGRIDLTLRMARKNVEHLLQLLRQGSGVVMRRDVSDAIKGELLAKVLALDIHRHTAKELRGNRDLFGGIYESVNVELASTIRVYGLQLDNFTVMWGMTQEERDHLRKQRHSGIQGVPEPTVTRSEKHRAFWQQLIDSLPEDHGFKKVPEAKPNRDLRFHFGLRGVSYRLVFAQKIEFSVDLYIDRAKDKEWNKRLFDNLEERKKPIESKLGETLKWMRLDDKNACRIRLSSDWRCTIDDHSENLNEVRMWMKGQLLAFKRVFGPMLEELAEEALVMELLRLDRISEAEAAEALDLDRWELIDVMGRYRVPSIRVTPEELMDDLAQSIQDARRG